MAENESLDLGSPNGRRWHPVCQALREGRSPGQVAQEMRRALVRALRDVLKQLASYGVQPQDIVEASSSPSQLRALLDRCSGHDYALLLRDVCKTHAAQDASTVLKAWVSGVVERVSDQIVVNEASIQGKANLFQLAQTMGEVRELLSPDAEQMGQRMADDPKWRPRLSPNDTQSLDQILGKSLLP